MLSPDYSVHADLTYSKGLAGVGMAVVQLDVIIQRDGNLLRARY